MINPVNCILDLSATSVTEEQSYEGKQKRSACYGGVYYARGKKKEKRRGEGCVLFAPWLYCTLSTMTRTSFMCIGSLVELSQSSWPTPNYEHCQIFISGCLWLQHWDSGLMLTSVPVPCRTTILENSQWYCCVQRSLVWDGRNLHSVEGALDHCDLPTLTAQAKTCIMMKYTAGCYHNGMPPMNPHTLSAYAQKRNSFMGTSKLSEKRFSNLNLQPQLGWIIARSGPLITNHGHQQQISSLWPLTLVQPLPKTDVSGACSWFCNKQLPEFDCHLCNYWPAARRLLVWIYGAAGTILVRKQ